ncbi:uncharacterized protein LOC113284029 [Papaver somniferum]|uniref:uncharacterized protein LOC113284029 n=1 Tax=Papaver somniferum TaxID=3469 RepID=UPI000E7057D7|nr:uncharacterized protein LOC113284029 [Papaver somniferum]
MKSLKPKTIFIIPTSHLLSSIYRVSHFSSSPSSISDSHSTVHSPSSSSSSRTNQEEERRNVKASVWWDFENCQVPNGVNVAKIAHRITSALRINGIEGPVSITAFGDVYQLSRANQEALSSTGISLYHVPHGKNNADRSLLVDLVYWVSQNPPPAHVLLISRDRDFANVLNRLRMSNYNVLLASLGNPPDVLNSSASITWCWNGLVSGEKLTGRRFNQPPVGFSSLYGQYKGPLEDPFLETQTTLQNVADLNTNVNLPPVPEALTSKICQIVDLHANGINICDLRSLVCVDKDFYGRKKFSKLLMSMSDQLKLVRTNDSKIFVHRARPKAATFVDHESSLPKNSTTDLKGENAESSVCVDNYSGFFGKIVNWFRVWITGPQADQSNRKATEDKGEIKGKAGSHEILSTSTDYAIEQYRKAVTNIQAEKCETLSTNSDLAKEKSSKDVTAKNIQAGYHELFSTSLFWEEIEVFLCSQKGRSLIKQAMTRLQIAEELKEKGPEVLRTLSVTALSHLIYLLISKKKWIEHCPSQAFPFSVIHSQLSPHHGINGLSAIVSPKSSSQGSLPRLSIHGGEKENGDVDSAWQELGPVCNTNSDRNDTKYSDQDRKTNLQLSFNHSTNRLSTIVSAKSSSQGNFQRLSAQEGEIEHPNHTEWGVDIDKSARQMLGDCQKLVTEILEKHPERFNMSVIKGLFLQKYGYSLELQILGHSNLSSLVRSIPGVRVEGTFVVPSGKLSCDFSVEKLGNSDNNDNSNKDIDISDSVENGDDDSVWEELGPVCNMNTSSPGNLPRLSVHGGERENGDDDSVWEELGPVCNKNSDRTDAEDSEHNRKTNLGLSSNHSTNMLSAIVSAKKSSQGNLPRLSFHEGEKEHLNHTERGVDSDKSARQMLMDCQKLVGEVMEKHPEGFSMDCIKHLFFERYGHSLKYQMLGHTELASLMQTIPGVRVEGDFIVPSGPRDFDVEKLGNSDNNDNYNNLDTGISGSVGNGDDDSAWEELGPILCNTKSNGNVTEDTDRTRCTILEKPDPDSDFSDAKFSDSEATRKDLQVRQQKKGGNDQEVLASLHTIKKSGQARLKKIHHLGSSINDSKLMDVDIGTDSEPIIRALRSATLVGKNVRNKRGKVVDSILRTLEK